MRPDIGNVPFQEAIDYFKEKDLVPTRHWDDMLGQQHDRAFTIAGVTKVDMLNDFKKAILEIKQRGGTLTDFRKEFDQIVARYGWSYKGKRGWRTKVIFETNMRTANAAGRWAQVQRRQEALKKRNPDATLYMTYRVLDHNLARRRLEHQAWNEITLPVDHPWWQTHYPPNGYGCACYVIVRTQRQIDAKKIKVTKNPPAIRRTERINKRTGEIYPPTPEGIDVGFDHLHGRSAYLPQANNIIDDRLGKQVAQTTIGSDDFKRLLDGKVLGTALVGYLPDGLPSLIGSKTNKIFLSSETAIKQKADHKELNINDYKSLPDVLSDGLYVKDGKQVVVFFHKGKQLYRAIVKSTRKGKELFLMSLTKTTDKELRKIRKRGQVVREEL